MRSLKIPALLAFLLPAAIALPACAGKGAKPTGEAGALQHQVVPLVGTSQVNRYTLDNGLRLLVVEDHTSPTFAYQTWFRVGSRDEVPGRTGLAHLFEHMMFKETKNLKDGEFDRILEAEGAEGENAFTSRDYTAYVEEMPKTKLELIMRLEADRMVNLVVNDQSFKTELEVVQNERRFRNENSPDGLMYQDIFEKAFTQHPYHWPVVGYQKDLESMNAQDARDFYRMYYSPNHATVVVVGDVDPDEVAALAQKYYGVLPGQASPVHAVAQEPPQVSPRRMRLPLNIQVDKLLIGYHIPGILDQDMPAIDVLQTVLTGGKSSRLSRALVDTGISSTVDAYDIEDKDPSLLIITTNLQKGKKAAQAEAVITKELAKLAKDGISEQELERAKNRVSFGFYEGLDSDSEKANFLGHYEAVANDFTLGIEHFRKIKDVTPADVQAAAKRYLEPRNRTAITGVPSHAAGANAPKKAPASGAKEG